LNDQQKFSWAAPEAATMRHDHNSSLWVSAAPHRYSWRRRLAVGGVAVAVVAIAAFSLRDQVSPRPGATCTQAWPYIDAGCAEVATSADLPTRPVRVIGIDRNAPAVVARAVPSPIEIPRTAVPNIEIGDVAPASAMPATALRPAATPMPPATDGAGPETTVEAPPTIAAAPISEEDLTFKTGAVHRPGAAAVKEEAAPEPPRRAAAKPRRAATRAADTPDRRRGTVTRSDREVQDRYGRRVRAADIGPRFDGPFGGFFGGRREPRSLGGLY
jgi:hypothetical protein